MTRLETSAATDDRFFDLQVNGYAGVDFNGDQLSSAELRAACEAMRGDGVERFLATIITDDLTSARRWQAEVDAAAVLVNASSRFVDGEEFGFGAEIGISTQKLHARGPMGLPEMTSTKYLVIGAGQVRE